MNILLIIDCQKGTLEGTYHGSLLKSDKKWMNRYYSMLNNIVDLVDDYDKVIFLIHKGGFKNKTRYEVVPELKHIYDKSESYFKYEDDGYSVIKEYIKKHNVDIVGMNTDACVIKTAVSSSTIANVSVIKKCCWSVYSASKNIFNRPFGESHNLAIRKMKQKSILIK